MPRNDNRTAAPNVFGKPNTTFSGDVTEFPIIVETRTANQDTTLKKLGTPHDRVATAFLISQVSKPGDNNDCVIIETYETLPGPYLPITRNDPWLGEISGTKRAVLNTNQVSSLSGTERLDYQSRDGSAVVSWEIIETNTDGNTGAGHPAFPIKTSNNFDNELGNVQETRQLVVLTGSESSTKTISGTAVTETDYQEYEPNSELVVKVVKLYNVPGNVLAIAEMHDGCQGEVATGSDTIIAATTAQYSPGVATLEYEDKVLDGVTKRRHILEAPFFPELTEVYYQMEKNGRKITKRYTVVDTVAQSPFSTPGECQEYRRINEWRCLQINTVWDPVPSYTERQRSAYSFPNLFDPSGFSWDDACGAFGTMKGERDVMAFFYVVHEWFDSFPSAQTYLILKPITHMVGRGWQPFVKTINDDLPYTYTGSCTGTYDFAASSPTLTSYNSLIGSGPQTMSESCLMDEDARFHRETFTLNLI